MNLIKTFSWIASAATSFTMGSTDMAQAATFSANITGDQVVPGTGSEASGTASFELNEAGTELSYTLSFQGVDLTPGDRTAPADINKIHIHAAPTGENGPHTLNIFGLPAEDDDDLVVDYAANTLSGVWDDGDVSDLNGNGISDPNDSKPLSNFLTALEAGDLYVQVHTNRFDSSTGFPGEIRGQILKTTVSPTASTPEPLGLLGLVAIAGITSATVKRR
ncbi:MAG: CHRD domain-containing protein [Phormidesmis sp.]